MKQWILMNWIVIYLCKYLLRPIDNLPFHLLTWQCFIDPEIVKISIPYKKHTSRKVHLLKKTHHQAEIYTFCPIHFD